MRTIHRVTLCLTAALACAGPLFGANLIGYGQVNLEVKRLGADQGVAVFTCEDEAHADRLLSKLRADFTWDKFLGVRNVTLRAGAPAYALDGSGVLVLARKKKQVYGVAAPSPRTALALLRRRGLTGRDVWFRARKRRPRSLDFFDLEPLSVYYLPLNVRDLAQGWQRYGRKALEQTIDFWAPFHFGCAFFHPYFGMDELVDGGAHFFPYDYQVQQATTRNLNVMAHLGLYWAPWWLRNRFPRDIVQWDPYAISGWNPLGAMAGTHLSQHASTAAYAYARRFTERALDNVKRAAGENLACFRPTGGGHPGDELGLHHWSTEFMDYGDAGQAAFRRWLRDDRHLTLRRLGQRWYGEEGRFHSWKEVRLPSHFEFFGGFGHGTFDLLTDWQWRPDSPAAETEGWYRVDYRPGEEWTRVDLAPSMKQLFLFGSREDKRLRQGRSKVAWFRREFDPSTWLRTHRGQQVYVVAQVGDTQTQPVEVWLNGACLGPIHPKTVWCGPLAFRATGLIRAGRNVLCLKVQSGLIKGPVFLTSEQPKRYPYLGVHGNARWVDLRDWEATKLVTGWEREARLARRRLPDTPLLFCPGSCMAFSDEFLRLKRELGIACIHYTGGGSSYMPWWAGLGYVLGAYMSSEEGGTISDPAGLSRELAWMLMDGHGHHNYYYDALDCMRLEQKTGWFSKNARLFQLYGKATWQRPPIAVLRAASTARYFPYSTLADDWDIGRSSLQAAHYQNVYVTEAEVKNGLADAYPVLWDAGTAVMDEGLLAAIERYVRGGGVFVAVTVTGRHSPLRADTWPMAKLTGFRVVGERKNMHVTVLPGNPLLKRLAGLTFNGAGLAVNWMGQNHLAEGAVALAPNDGAGVALAKWEDGTIAAGVRRLGKGRVIVLASSFWRSMSDRTGSGVSLNGSLQTTFFTDLLSGLGIQKQADIDSESVWTRRFTTKNGLQEWVMVYNAGRGPATGRTLTFPLARRPRRVVDVVTGKPVEFTWKSGVARVTNISLARNELRVFGVDRPGFLPALTHWFAEKVRYESRGSLAASPAEPASPLPPSHAVTISRFRFRPADERARTDLSWLTEPVGGPLWKDMGYGFWDEHGYPATGVGLYRSVFHAPAAWRGRRVLLGFLSWDYPVFLENAAIFLNGKRLGEYHGHGWANFDVLDATPALKAGDNELALLVEARQARGGYLGQLALFPMETLHDPIELSAGWNLYSDNHHFTRVSLPLDADGRHLETQVDLPADWKADRIFLEFEVSRRCVGIVVVNGRPAAFNQYLHPYGDIMQVNLYPWARPGRVNRIELWPRSPETTATQRWVVHKVRLGTVAGES